jgi:hypothetical protein
MIQKQNISHKKAVKPPPPQVKVRIEKWCRDHRILILSLIIAVSALFRIVYFIQLNKTDFINQHIWNESDMSFFDYWAGEIAKGDILSSEIHQPEHTWMKWVADHYFNDHPEKLAYFKAKIGADTVKNSPTKLLWQQWYGEKTFQQEPLYAYFLAANYSLFGHNVRWVFLWQMLFGVITNLLVYLVTRRYFGDLPATIAGVLIIFFGPVLFFELVLLRSSLAVFFGILVIYLLGTAIRKETFAWWIISGIGTGLAILVHAFFILFLAGAVITLLFNFRKDLRQGIRSAGGILIGVILVLTPVMIRNAKLGAPVMSLSNTSTLSFVTMNNDKFESFIGWNMNTKYLADIMGSSNGKLFKAILPTLMTHKSVGSYLAKVWDKLHATFSWYEISNNVNFYFYREFAWILSLTFLSFLFISPLAITGIFLVLFRKINAWPLYLMFLVFLFPMLAFMVLSRYRIILAVVMIPLAAFTIAELFTSWKGWKNYLVLFSIVIVGFWASKPGLDKVSEITVDDYSSSFVIHYKDDIEKAIAQQKWEAFIKVLNAYITAYEPDKIKTLKPMYKCEGRTEPAIFSYFSNIHSNLGRVYALSGDTASAKIEEDLSKKIKTAANQ